MLPCSTHVNHGPTFPIQFLPDPRISLVSILPMTQPLLLNTGFTRGTKTKDAFPSVTIQFRSLVSLTWMAHINTCSYIDGTGTTITLHFRLWLNTHYSGIICGKKCLDEIQERKRNFMNTIPSTCFKQFFYRCFLLTVKPKQSQSQSIHFPGIASCQHLSSGGKTIVFETYLVQWNVGQSSCHDSCLGNVRGVPKIITFWPVQWKLLFRYVDVFVPQTKPLQGPRIKS